MYNIICTRSHFATLSFVAYALYTVNVLLFVNEEMIILSTLTYCQCQSWWLYSVYVPLYNIVAIYIMLSKNFLQRDWFLLITWCRPMYYYCTVVDVWSLNKITLITVSQSSQPRELKWLKIASDEIVNALHVIILIVVSIECTAV